MEHKHLSSLTESPKRKIYVYETESHLLMNRKQKQKRELYKVLNLLEAWTSSWAIPSSFAECPQFGMSLKSASGQA